MTTSTIVDSNVLIDVVGPVESAARQWSLAMLRQSAGDGTIVFSAIVWAELAHSRSRADLLTQAFAWLRPVREDFPFAAADQAGIAHRLYRERGGTRQRTLPDFLIGAHALVSRRRLLTRDASRYRSYFPDLQIIAPDSHP